MPDIAGGLSLYPRGFLGRPLGPRIERKPKPLEMRLNGLQGDSISFGTTSTKVDANANVEALYSRYIKRAGSTTDFEFREQVLIVALNAFGTASFSDWFFFQFKSPALGDTHRRFLADTLCFITKGRRELSLENWQALVTLNDHGQTDDADIGDAVRAFFNISVAASVPDKSVSLTDVISWWCAQPNGIEDLLGTLHILFGDI